MGIARELEKQKISELKPATFHNVYSGEKLFKIESVSGNDILGGSNFYHENTKFYIERSYIIDEDDEFVAFVSYVHAM